MIGKFSRAVLVQTKPKAALALLIPLAACSLSERPTVERYGPGLSSPASISLLSSGEDSRHQTYKKALELSFAGEGLSVAQDGTYVADFAISARPSDSAIAVVRDTDQEVDYVSAARERELLQECAGERLRATLVVFDRSDGSLAFRAMRETDVCEVTDGAISAMADELVSGAVNR